MVAVLQSPEHTGTKAESSDPRPNHDRRDATSGLRFAAIVCLLSIVACVCILWKLDWSWDVDEVESLQELGLLGGENIQTIRLSRMVPVWTWSQTSVMALLPINERTVRLLPAVCGIVLVILSFVWTARRYGLPLAICLAMLILASPLFLELAQMNRFYTMALLLQFLAQAAILSPVQRFPTLMIFLSVVLALAAILCHNLLLTYIVLTAAATCLAYVFGWCNRPQLVRSLAAAAAGVCLYLLYLRPLVQGWNNFLPHRTTLQVALSLLSEAGIPMLVLALMGAALSLQKEQRVQFGYWAVLGASSCAFILAAPMFIWFFNYRYALLFLFPIWLLAAKGMYGIAQKLADRRLRWAWYSCVVLLLIPKLLSYYQDGSRWDLRSAAGIVSQLAEDESPTVYSNLISIVHYYLPSASVKGWQGEKVPEQTCFLVLATNAWDSPVHAEGHVAELVASIGRRRFDEQAYLVRVYRLRPITTVSPPPRSTTGRS